MTKNLTQAVMSEIEKAHPNGLSSAQILDILAAYGFSMTEATLRKYIQQGIVPRSVRVGQKGKHKGSSGIYPVSVVRRLVLIRDLLAQNVTIEEMKRDVLFAKDDIGEVEKALSRVLLTFDKKRKRDTSPFSKTLTDDIRAARIVAEDLVSRLQHIEGRLIGQSGLSRASA